METHTGIKTLECSECGYQCSDEQVFNEHMKVHTGEKSIASDISELVSDARSACKKQVSPTIHGNVHKCTECWFKCSIKQEMINHLISICMW